MSAPATRDRKKASKTAAAKARKPYSRPAPTPAPAPDVQITPEAQDQERDRQKHLESLQPEVLASDLDHWANMFKAMSQMLKTDTGKQDSFLHHITRWYVDQIEALDKVPVLAQTVQQCREDAFGNHLHGSEDDGDEEKEHKDGHASIIDHCAKCLAKEIS